MEPVGGPVDLLDEDTKVLVGTAVAAVAASVCFAAVSVGVAALTYVLRGNRG